MKLFHGIAAAIKYRFLRSPKVGIAVLLLFAEDFVDANSQAWEICLEKYPIQDFSDQIVYITEIPYDVIPD